LTLPEAYKVTSF